MQNEISENSNLHGKHQNDSNTCLPQFLLNDSDGSDKSSPSNSIEDSSSSDEDFPEQRKLGPPSQHKFYSVDDIKSKFNFNHNFFEKKENPSSPAKPIQHIQSFQLKPMQKINLGIENGMKTINLGPINPNMMGHSFSPVRQVKNPNINMNPNMSPHATFMSPQNPMFNNYYYQQQYNFPQNNGNNYYNNIMLQNNIQNNQFCLEPNNPMNGNVNVNINPNMGSPVVKSPNPRSPKINNSKKNNANNNNSNNNKKNYPLSPSPKKSKRKKKNKKVDIESLSVSKFLSAKSADLYHFIVTQKGSRDVQGILKKFTENDVDILIAKLSQYISEIMLDKYGNYFIQRLIQNCSPHQREEILKSIEKNFTQIACDSFGTHPLQALIEIINMPSERKILQRCIEGNELKLSVDSKGTHVIQKFISCYTEAERENVTKNIMQNLPKLLVDSFGVCVLIKLLKYTTDESIKETFAKYIDDNNPLSFIQNPYANYAVQALFNEKDIKLCGEIIKVIKEHFFSLSMQKFSSNVVENCLKFCDQDVINDVFVEVMKDGKLGSLLNNTYGSFVIEKLISRMSKEQKKEMIREITKIGKEKNLSTSMINLLYR